MELTTLARPYATAAFRFAREQPALKKQALENWSDTLNVCAAIVKDSAVSTLLDQPSLAPSQKADAFLAVCDNCLALDESQQNFLRILGENRKITLLPQVAELFDVLKAEQEQSIEADVASPFPLTSEQQQVLVEKLGKRLSAKVTLNNFVDPDMIGGLIIRAGDLVIDNSIRTRLAKLAHTMLS